MENRTVGAQAAPAPPAYILARAFEDSRVTLLWEESKQAEGYLIHRGEEPQHLKALTATEENSYIDIHTQPGKTYYYTVRAFNEHGQSAASDVAAITLPGAQRLDESDDETKDSAAQPQAGKRLRVVRKRPETMQEDAAAPRAQAPPPAPTGLRVATQGTKFIALSWQAPQSELEYRIYRSETPWRCYGLIAETTETQYLDAVPEAATKYYYFVQAVQQGRVSQASPMAEGMTFPALPPPETPQNLRAAPQGADGIELRWNPARAAAAYVVYARLDPNDDFATIGHTLDCGWLHEGLPPDSFVDYRVQAYHDSGVSELSGVCTGRSGVARPAARSRPAAPPNPQPGPANARRFPAFSMQAFQR